MGNLFSYWQVGEKISNPAGYSNFFDYTFNRRNREFAASTEPGLEKVEMTEADLSTEIAKAMDFKDPQKEGSRLELKIMYFKYL